MAEQGQTNGAASDPVTQPFVQLWSSLLEQTDQNARQLTDMFDGHRNLQRWQRQWLEAMTQSLEASLRGPAFLEVMKVQLDAIIRARSQANDLTQAYAQNADLPLASDISGLFERVRSVEDKVLSQLAHLEARLEQIQQQLSSETAKNAQPGELGQG